MNNERFNIYKFQLLKNGFVNINQLLISCIALMAIFKLRDLYHYQAGLNLIVTF